MNGLRDSQLQLLWTARIDYAEGSRVEAHQHADFDQFFIVLSGAGRVISAGESYVVQEGSAFLFMRGITHSFHFTEETLTLDFKFRLLDPALIDVLSHVQASCLCQGSDLSEIKQWYKLSLMQMRVPESVHPLRIEAGFKSTLVSLLLNDASLPAGPSTVLANIDENEPIVAYMKINIAEKITLDRLSKRFGFNPNYLIKVFSDRTGLTPIQYLQEIRLQQAKEYLEFTALPITEIAGKVGWSLPYFSTFLKKREGLSPSQYRSSLLNEVGKDIILEHDFANEWIVKHD
ncbi:helix-turn-helix transcriptional regulator [Paenibacillus agricola]|uniref:AraC family transcriptional regulator n=1 Tax=Paenibacillus agricola TaxID=2716264 RepID=A0ABX0J444_9BACL|nr:helix-turn-helix domain-containing protein [Paenibacillus agricola]NHN30181.1 AraC family transcriptional regulator [Paenibacillus agricola]